MTEQFLAEIYASPDSDAPRLVYADALLERGDPRGELIALQCRGTLDDAQRDRVAQLVARHGRDWLGDLRAVIGSHRFERGFLAACHVDNKELEPVRRVVGHRAWSTVRELSGSALVGLHPVMRGLRALHFHEENASNHEKLPAAWRDLLLETPRELERLEYRLSVTESWDNGGDITATPHSGGVWTIVLPQEQLDALCVCPALPKLRALIIEGQAGDWTAQLATSPVVQRLDELGFAFKHDGFPSGYLDALLRGAPVQTLSFTTNPGPSALTLRLGRRGDHYVTAAVGIASTAPVAQHPQLTLTVLETIRSLPKSVTEVRISTPELFEPRERLNAGLQAISRLIVREV